MLTLDPNTLFKGLVVGDCHFCDYVPIKRKDDFIEAQFKKLDTIKVIAESRGVSVTFLLGDIFDKARPSTWLINRLIKEFKNWPSVLMTVVGNHDIQGSRDGITTTALGTLLEAGVIRKLEGDTTYLNLPLRGISHTREHSSDLYKSSERKIIFTHNMITPWDVPFTHTHTDDILEAAKNNIVFAGDYHGAYDKSSSVYNSRVINPGVLIRTDIAEKSIQPSVIYFEVTKAEFVRKVEKIPLNAGKGVDVFDVARHLKTKEAEMDLKSFIESIQSTQFQSQDIVRLVREVGAETKISKEVISEAVKRIQTAKAES